MVILKILKYPDKRLRKIAQPVKKVNKNIKKIIHNMFETMYENKGIGLAATQVNIHLKIIVIDIMKKKYQPLILINPKKIKEQGVIKIEESCLSVPEKKKIITRSKEIEILALNYYGEKIKIIAKSLLSICIQHEMDHLIGKLLIDY
ncbi:peptide deformylase [Buchnera aphidicola]|uniref:Peptide deformylase n=1 Tax=Buchnera aphidicola (Therioaphis trifolii) TaxID=1241884 RepID=A0A4D6YN42_9GAMM|nr:peptide deformylase [Buchnera aphidicola]QCI27308.1 peptide deformylase [Buchnera aphidicola (Therioaphis trifolii)]